MIRWLRTAALRAVNLELFILAQAALQGRVTEAEARAGAQLAAIADRQARLKNAARAASPTAPPFEALEALEEPARDGTGAGALQP